jgi:hypothetical protein
MFTNEGQRRELVTGVNLELTTLTISNKKTNEFLTKNNLSVA